MYEGQPHWERCLELMGLIGTHEARLIWVRKELEGIIEGEK